MSSAQRRNSLAVAHAATSLQGRAEGSGCRRLLHLAESADVDDWTPGRLARKQMASTAGPWEGLRCLWHKTLEKGRGAGLRGHGAQSSPVRWASALGPGHAAVCFVAEAVGI